MGQWFEPIVGMLASLGMLVLWFGLRDLGKARRTLPFLSILVVFRNQAAIAEGTIRELAALPYAAEGDRNFEIVAVDDRSSDETPQILDRLARELGRLRVVHMSEMDAPGQGPVDVGAFLSRGPLVLLLLPDRGLKPAMLVDQVRALLDGSGVGEQQEKFVVKSRGI